MKKNNPLQLLWRRVTRRRRHERLARQIVAQHGMLNDYRAARRSGLSPIQALEEWDLLRPEDRQMFD
jgi:hypothetical protein